MRRIITCLLTLLFLSFYAVAQQVPNGFNYQSIARDAIGLPIVNSQINLRITVRQNNISGTDVWQETQSATTNQFGLINLVIGNGTKTGGLTSITGINGIDWASDKFFIIVEVNNGGSYVSLGITQFQSVPYALAADNALKIQGSKVGAIIPTANQFLKFNAISGQWEPGNISGANGGTVVSVGGIGPITVTGTVGLDPQIGILQSTAIQDGYLSSLDWAAFSNKLGTTTGFGGNVVGTYNAITVTGIQNIPVAAIAPTNGQILIYDGIQWVPTTTGASGSVLTVTGNGEISVTPGNSPIISISTASGISNGIITMADYISFSNKLSVNSIAGGDLSGPYNNLLINSIGGIPISLASAPAGAVLSFNGIGFVPALLSSTVSISSTTPGVSASGTVINIATADGVTMGLLAPSDYNRFGNKIGPGTTLTGGDVAGSYQDGFTVTGLGTKNLNITGILPGQVLSFNGTSFVPGTPASGQLTSVTGINGIIVGGSGTLYSVDGSNLLTVTTVFGGDLNGTYNAITVNRIQSVPFSMAGIANGQYLYYNGTSIVGANISAATAPTITGINGITLNTNTGYDFTISGQTLATYSGDNLLTTLTGTFPNFIIAGISQSQNATTITGTNGLSVVGSGFSQTIVGQSFVGTNGIVVSSTGNTFTISNTVPGLSLFGDNVNTSVVGANNNYTVLGIGSGSQWVSTTGGIYYPIGVGINTLPLTVPSISPLTIGTSSTWDIAFVPGGGGTATIHSVQDLILLSDANLIFNTNTVDRLKILSSGEIGIGTSNPNERLTVQGNSSVSGVSYASGFRANTLTLTGIGSGILTVDGLGNVTTTSLSFATTQTTLTGTNGLSVAGSGFTQTIIGQSFTGANGIVVSSTGTTFTISNTTPGLSLFGDNVNTSVVGANNNYTVLGIGSSSQWITTTAGLYIKSFVGIGTGNPLNDLHVSSSVPGVSAFITSSNSDNSNFINLYSGDASNNFGGIGFSSGGNLEFGTLTSPRNTPSYLTLMKLTNTGNLGIGVASPLEKLSIGGNITASGWAALNGIVSPSITLTGIGSGILTVDGVGNVTTTSLSFATTQTTLTGTNGLSVTGSGFAQTIVGQSFTGTNGIVVSSTGNTFTISNTTPGLNLFGDGINTSVVGGNNNYTVLGIGTGVNYGVATGSFQQLLMKNSDNTIIETPLLVYDGTLNILNTNNGDITLGTAGDGNHGIGIYLGPKSYAGEDVQGPVIYGNSGGAFGRNNANAPDRIAFGWRWTGAEIRVSVNNNDLDDATATFDVNGSARIRNLSVTGSVITVDGLGNLGMAAYSAGASQWLTTTTAFNAGIVYTNSFVGIGNVQTAAPNDANLHINSNGEANILLDGSSPSISFWSSVNDASIFTDAADNNKLKFASALTIDAYADRVSFTRMTIDPTNGNIGIGTTNPNERLTIQGNSSVSGIGYALGLRTSTLTLTGIGSGILTVDGLGNVTTTSINLTGVFTQSVAGNSFTNDNIVIQGTTTPGVAKLKVKGDLSAGGQVIASQTMNPTGTASTTVTGATLYKQRIYIPEGTNSLNASFNAYEFIGTSGSSGNIFIYINGLQVGLAITFSAPSDQNTTMTLTNIPVAGLSGFQNLEIRARAGAANDGVILQGYTLVIND